MLAPLSILLISLFNVVFARQAALHLSSVSYCSPPADLIIKQFDVSFYRQNSSLVFTIVAESTKDLNLSGNAIVNSYGSNAFNLTFDLCSLTIALCPVRQSTFNVSSAISLPSSVTDRIPNIAYTVPDLEVYAQMTLTEQPSNEQIACVTVTVSNGLSTRQKSVTWTVGALAILFATTCVVFTALSFTGRDGEYLYDDRSPSSLSWRLIEFMETIQHITLTALLELDYPVVYSSFALNFAWSFGLFSMGRKSNIQSSIYNLRSVTGVKNVTEARDPITWGDRNSSPYNAVLARSNPLANTTGLVGVTPYVANESTIPPGLATYVNALGITGANAYMSVYFTAMILIAIILAVFVIGYVLLVLLGRKASKDSVAANFRSRYWSFVSAVSIRFAMVMAPPISAVAFYQWTLHDSWLPTLLSVLLWIWIWCLLAVFVVQLIRAYRAETLFETPTFHRLRALHEPHRSSRWFFTVAVTLPSLFVKAILVGFVQSTGWVQVIGLMVVELAVLHAHCIYRPGLTLSADVLSIILSVIRLVSLGLLIAFEHSLRVRPITRVIIGFVILAILSVGILILVGDLFRNLFVRPLFSAARRRRYPLLRDDNALRPVETLDRGAVTSVSLPPRY